MYGCKPTIELEAMGHLATSTVRDAIEDLVSGTVDAGEELVVSQEGDGRLSVTLRSPKRLGVNDLSGLATEIRSACADCLNDDAEMLISGFEVVEVPNAGFCR